MTATITMTGMTFSPEYVQLCQRRRDLSAIEAAKSMAAAEIAALWNALADDFENMGYINIADDLRKKAQRLGER